MKFKTVTLLIIAAFAMAAFTGCAQDSTDTTDANPTMQERLLKGQDDTAVDERTRKAEEQDAQ